MTLSDQEARDLIALADLQYVARASLHRPKVSARYECPKCGQDSPRPCQIADQGGLCVWPLDRRSA